LKSNSTIPGVNASRISGLNYPLFSSFDGPTNAAMASIRRKIPFAKAFVRISPGVHAL
jgi:hypothetical protein